MDVQLVVAALIFVFAVVSIAGRWSRMDDRRRAGAVLLLLGAALQAFVADFAADGALSVESGTITGVAVLAMVAGLALVLLGSESSDGEGARGAGR